MFGTLWKRWSAFFQKGIEVSYTRVNTYQTCPWKYKLVYIDGFHTPPNPFISLGLSVHRALEDFHQRHASGAEELMDSYHKMWVNEGFASPQQTHEFYERGRRMLENYWETHRTSRSEIVYLEKDFRITVGKNRLRGVIDRIDRYSDGSYEVIDYKTHYELWKQDKVDSHLQLSLYALACERALGFTPQVLSCYFLAHNMKVSTRRSAEQIAAALETVGYVAEKIMQEVFTPDVTHCHKCDFRKSCIHSAQQRN